MEEKKVSQNREKKEKIVAEIADKLSHAKGLVFANYQGLTHVQLEKLKRKVKAANADLVVTKNTLLSLALANSKFEARNSKQYQNSNDKNSKHLSVSDFGFRISDFGGPTATLFLYSDPIEPLKALAKMIKELKLPTIKLGIIEGRELTSDEVLKLSALPSREVLIAQVVGQMKAPIYGLHRALSWNMQKLVLTLKAIEGKRS